MFLGFLISFSVSWDYGYGWAGLDPYITFIEKKMTEFIDPTPNNLVDEAKFLELLNHTPILAMLKEFYWEPVRYRHPHEAVLRLLPLCKLKRFRFLTELWKLLADETLKLLGFK